MKRQSIIFVCSYFFTVLAGGAATLQVDKERSRIQVDAKATGHKFTGTLKEYTATVSGDPQTLDPSSFELKWKFSDLKTGDEKRDHEMIKWLGGGKPSGAFQFTKTWMDEGARKGQGKLTIHGVSKAVAFPYSVKKEGEWVTIDGTARLDYENFGLPVIRSMAVMTVDPKLVVRFHLVGKVK